MLLDVISKIELFVGVFGAVYAIALILYVLTSWVRLPYSLSWLQRFLYDLCDPYLRLWRRLLPFGVGAIDFTPMIAIFSIGVIVAIIDAILNHL